MENHFYAVIMAGGGGTRLWPLSRKESPKQLLEIINDKSLFRIAVDRLKGLFEDDHIYVVTVAEQIEKLHEQAPEIPLQNFLIEPMPRGTASVVGLAAIFFQNFDPNAVMAVLTADHVMENISVFQKLLCDAKTAALNGFLVTLGIEPAYSSTGYGYIEAGKAVQPLNIFNVRQFHEKPDQKTAEKYIKEGTYFWNSGMFIWSVQAILNEFQRQMPQLYQILEKIQSRIKGTHQIEDFTDIWEGIQSQTIDYGIMEGASNVAVLPAKDLGWIDVGSWDALYSVLETDQDDNILLADRSVSIDSQGILVLSSDPEKMIAVVGLENIVIVDHQNTLLVCKKEDSQKVRQVIKELKSKKLSDYL